MGVFDPPVLGDVSGTFVFTEDQADDVFQTFTWSEADFGFRSATTYTLQIDFAGDDFASPVDLATTTATSVGITVGALNQKLLAMGAKTNLPSDIEVRVTASVNDNVQTLISNIPVMNIQPYKVVIIYPSLYLPGNYQAASGYESDWSPDKAQQIYSLKQNEKYEGYVNMVGDDIQFKFTDEPNWDVNWGDTGADGYLALDVYEEEGDLFYQDLSNRLIQDDTFARLLTFPNVLITGHQAFLTHNALRRIAEITLANVRAFEQDRPLENEVLAQRHLR